MDIKKYFLRYFIGLFLTLVFSVLSNLFQHFQIITAELCCLFLTAISAIFSMYNCSKVYYILNK